MPTSRQLRLGAFMRPVSIHTGAWRYPGAFPDANFNFAHYKRFAQTLERGCFDAIFLADHLAVLNMPMAALKRSATVTSFEPLTLLSALAVVTDCLGLIATASTTYDEPFHIARKFASLDHLSSGRAGWNVVTTANPQAALNFGLDAHVEHGERYHRAREFFDVVTGLWDSWADDAFIRDVEAGIYFDPEKLHVLAHKGEHLSVRGPLNIARPIQGWPVIVQAGSSDAGRQLRRLGDDRHAHHDRRPDGRVAGQRSVRRLQRHVPLPSGRPRRLRRPRGAGTAAARPLPARVRGNHAAREPRPAAAEEPVLLKVGAVFDGGRDWD
jgi:FMN-dependent oxidoreductase (nitrilotriacetate monooxygenase family)